MLTLPDAIVAILFPFAMLFQHRTWQKAQVLLIGTVLPPGQRTVAAALRVMGRSGDRNYARYHHLLNRAAWSPLGASQMLLSLLLQHLDHSDGPLVFGIDETLDQRQQFRQRKRRDSQVGRTARPEQDNGAHEDDMRLMGAETGKPIRARRISGDTMPLGFVLATGTNARHQREEPRMKN